MRALKQKLHPPDFWLTAVTIVLVLFGLVMVYDSSVAIAIRDFSDQYYFVKEQFRWFIVGTGVFIAVCLVPYHSWYRLAMPLLILTLILLAAVFLPGIGVRAQGASRWINMGIFVFQPAELAKLSLVIYLAAWFSYPERKRIGAFLLLLTLIVGLVVAEPDLGTAFIILATAIVLYFLSGAPLWQFFLLIPVLGISVATLAIVSPYRMRRLTTFFNPDTDPLGASYQIRQVLLALGSGGWFGIGVGQSRQKYEYLPEANTDSIFAIVGEEFGFVGTSVVILLFLFLVWRGFRIAKRAPDNFGRNLALGISSWIGIQTVINLAAMVALIPLTGVPLPLISYGGSSLILTLAGIGILVNISRQRSTSL